VNPASAAYAQQYLRDNDRDRYLATLVLPEKAQAAVTALYAFSADLASVRERAREPAAGEIRLQWWADALTGEGHGAVRQNPLADALLDTIGEYRLPAPPLTRMIGARRFDLYQDAMPDVATFEGYAGETVSALYQMAAMILNGGRPVEPGDAAGHLGVAQALVGHLRAFGYNASRGRIFLPWEVFAACGVSEGEVLAGEASEALGVALGRFAEMADGHLMRAETAIAALPRELRAVFAPIAVVRMQRRRLRVEMPFQRQGDLSDWRKIAALGWWRMRN
jgi:phytoene synthase